MLAVTWNSIILLRPLFIIVNESWHARPFKLADIRVPISDVILSIVSSWPGVRLNRSSLLYFI